MSGQVGAGRVGTGAHIAPAGGDVYGQPAVAVLELDAGALLQEELGHLHVAVGRRHVQLRADR